MEKIFADTLYVRRHPRNRPLGLDGTTPPSPSRMLPGRSTHPRCSPRFYLTYLVLCYGVKHSASTPYNCLTYSTLLRLKLARQKLARKYRNRTHRQRKIPESDKFS